MKALAVNLLLLSVSLQSFIGYSTAPVSQEKYRAFINRTWRTHGYESTVTRTLKFLPRLVGRTIKSKIYGYTGQAIIATILYPALALHPNRNPLATIGRTLISWIYSPFISVAHLAADAASKNFELGRAHHWSTNRIQACSFTFPLLPAEHIYFQLDDMELNNAEGIARWNIDTDILDGSRCFNVTSKRNVSPTMAAEKLTCIANYYSDHDHTIFANNCGFMTKQALADADLNYPISINLGIGGNFAFHTNSTIKRSHNRRKICIQHETLLLYFIYTLEAGLKLEMHLDALFKSQIGKEAELQLLISAFRMREENPHNWELISENIGNHLNYFIKPNRGMTGYYKKYTIPKNLRTFVHTLLGSLTLEELKELKQHYKITRLIEHYEKTF